MKDVNSVQMRWFLFVYLTIGNFLSSRPQHFDPTQISRKEEQSYNDITSACHANIRALLQRNFS